MSTDDLIPVQTQSSRGVVLLPADIFPFKANIDRKWAERNYAHRHFFNKDAVRMFTGNKDLDEFVNEARSKVKELIRCFLTLFIRCSEKNAISGIFYAI